MTPPVSPETPRQARETRFQWEPVALPDGWQHEGPGWPAPPDGWRRCENQTLSPDGMTMTATYTDAPRTESPFFGYENVWVTLRRYTEHRYVTPWERSPEECRVLSELTEERTDG